MRKIFATFLFLTAGLLAPLPARAQSFSVGYTYYPYSRLEQVSGTPSPDSPTHIRVNTLQALISYPLKFNQGRTQLENTIVYNFLKFDYRGAPSLLESVQSYSYTAFFTHDFLNGLGIIAVVTPGFADDFHGPATSSAITLSMALACSYKFSEDFKVGLGVAIDTTFGEDLLMPVASVDWAITDQLWLESVLPISVQLTYLPIRLIGFRATVAVTGNRFHGDANRYNVENPQLNYSVITGDLGMRWFILPWLHLSIHGGATLYRRFEFSDGRKSFAKYDPTNCAVFKVYLGVGE